MKERDRDMSSRRHLSPFSTLPCPPFPTLPANNSTVSLWHESEFQAVINEQHQAAGTGFMYAVKRLTFNAGPCAAWVQIDVSDTCSDSPLGRQAMQLQQRFKPQ